MSGSFHTERPSESVGGSNTNEMSDEEAKRLLEDLVLTSTNNHRNSAAEVGPLSDAEFEELMRGINQLTAERSDPLIQALPRNAVGPPLPRLTPDDIRISKTAGPKDTDAVVQQLNREREKDDGFRLRDLELTGEESGAEAIEDRGGPSARAEEGPIQDVKLETAEPAPAKHDGGANIGGGEPVVALDALDESHRLPMKVRELMRAKRAEIDGEIDLAEDDPLAKDKKRVTNALKKVGRSAADLPPDFWKLPKFAKIPLERSRQSELGKIFAGVEEERRIRELEKRGRPANYSQLPRAEQERTDANIRQRRHREKKRKPPSKPTITPLPVAHIAPDSLSFTLTRMLRSLNAWSCASGAPRARQLRDPEQQRALIRTAAAYSRFFQQHDKSPSHANLAKWLRWSTGQTRRKLNLLKSLYEPGGPWA